MRRTIAIASVVLALAAPAAASAAPTARQVNRAGVVFHAAQDKLIACGANAAKARCVNNNIWALYTPVRTLVNGLPHYCKQDAALVRFEKAAGKFLGSAVGSYMLPADKSYASAALDQYLVVSRALAKVAC